MFIDLFYLMRARGLNVSMNEWLSLMDALEKGLCRNSLLEFYYLSRAILIKTEADFDKFDEVFLVISTGFSISRTSPRSSWTGSMTPRT